MNVGKIRRLLHQAERLLGGVDKSRHGHRHDHHHGRRRGGAGNEVLKQILRRFR
jgi:hypothetical protein